MTSKFRKPDTLIRIFPLLLAAVLLVTFGAGCSKAEEPESPTGGAAPISQLSISPTPSPELSPSAQGGAAAPTDPFGNEISTFTEDVKPYFPLVAALPEEDTYLYGIKDSAGMVLFHAGRGHCFDWPEIGPRVVLPQLLADDLDGDGQKELAVILGTGSGTGVSLSDLHVVSGLYQAGDGEAGPADHLLSSDNVYDMLSEIPLSTELSEDKSAFTVTVLGQEYTFGAYSDGESGAFTGAEFNPLTTGVELEDGHLRAWCAVGARYENIAPVQDFGIVKASVTFDGEAFHLEDVFFLTYGEEYPQKR